MEPPEPPSLLNHNTFHHLFRIKLGYVRAGHPQVTTVPSLLRQAQPSPWRLEATKGTLPAAVVADSGTAVTVSSFWRPGQRMPGRHGSFRGKS